MFTKKCIFTHQKIHKTALHLNCFFFFFIYNNSVSSNIFNNKINMKLILTTHAHFDFIELVNI